MARYSEGYGRRIDERAKKRSVVMTAVDVIMAFVSILAIILLTLTFVAPYINPGSMWIFSILGLLAPAVYCGTLLLMLYWIIRWQWQWASILMLLVFLGLFKVSLFYKPEFKRHYEDASSERNTLKFMTYNVRQFYSNNGQSSADSVLKMIGEVDPDILCMQEFNTPLVSKNSDFAQLLEIYNSAVGVSNVDVETLSTAPLVIFSKFPIIHTGGVLSQSDIRESIWADLLIEGDTVRIFNNHLHSTAITSSDDDFITNHRYLSDTTRNEKIRSIVRRFRDNSILRAAQVDTIALAINATPYEKIVCGDFNDTPMSYVYRTMAGDLTDAFRERGLGYAHTFRGFHNTLRIDYVLSSDRFEPLSYQMQDVDYSDHHPVVVKLKYKKKN
ncbi:MAG: endonuclease/exonuclease/phosphatase family protein [Alistipes sp.]